MMKTGPKSTTEWRNMNRFLIRDSETHCYFERSVIQMAEPKIKEEEKEETSFKGTFASVMLLGGFLILSWLGVWLLFLSR